MTVTSPTKSAASSGPPPPARKRPTLLARRRSLIRWGPTGGLLAILVVLAVIPLAMLFYASFVDAPPRPGSVGGTFTLDNFGNLISPGVLQAAGNSVLISVGGTLLALLIGSTLAWLGARTDVPAKWMVQLAGIVPLFMSSLVAALAWGLLFAPSSGYLNILLEGLGIPIQGNSYSLGMMIFVFGIYYAPYPFLLVYGALSLMNPDLEEAARIHGARGNQVMRFITMPLVKPALISSALLSFALIMENFPVPTILGSPKGIHTLPSYLYLLMSSAPPKANQAASIGVLLLVGLVVVVYLQRRILAKQKFTTVTGKGVKPRKIALGRWRWAGFSFCALYIIIALVLPFGALLLTSVRGNPYIGGLSDLFDVSSFSLKTFNAVINYDTFQVGLRNSLLLGALAAVIGIVLYVTMAFTVHRSKAPGRQAVEYIAMAPIAVPALVFGMGFLWTWFLLPIPIYGTIAIIVLAYIVIFMPQGFSSISTSLQQVHADLEQSAQVAGANRFTAARKITVPLIRSSVVSALLLTLILTMRELSVAIFLVTSKTRVLSISIFDFWDSGRLNWAAASSILYSLVLVVIVLMGTKYLGVKSNAVD